MELCSADMCTLVCTRQPDPISSHLSTMCLPGFHRGTDLWNWLVELFHQRLQTDEDGSPWGKVSPEMDKLVVIVLQPGSGKNGRKLTLGGDD